MRARSFTFTAATTAAAAAMTAFISLAAPAAAEQTFGPKRPFKIGNWFGGAHYYVGNGAFSHCAMMTPYRSGIVMFFAIDSSFKWRMAFANPAWNLESGRNYQVTYVIDQHAPSNVSVRAAKKDLAVAELQPNAGAFQQFRLGRLLTVYAERDRFQFRLDGTAKALAELLDCAKANAAVAHGPGPAPAPAVEFVTPEEKLEATRLVANMLSHGQLREFKMMTSAELADPTLPRFIKTADVAWKAPGTLGVLHIIRNPRKASLDELAAMAMAGDAAACKGRFVSGKIPDADLPSIRREFTSCQDGAQNFYLEYIFVPRPDGSAYRFGTFSSGTAAGERAREPDDRLRNAVQEVVFRN